MPWAESPAARSPSSPRKVPYGSAEDSMAEGRKTSRRTDRSLTARRSRSKRADREMFLLRSSSWVTL